MTSEENDYCRLLPAWSWYVVAPFVMADNKQWKGRWGEDVGSEGYWRTAYPSFVIVFLWLGLAYLHFFHIFTSMIFSFLFLLLLWLDLGLCCLSQFVTFIWEEQSETQDFLALLTIFDLIFTQFPTNGLSIVLICDLFVIGRTFVIVPRLLAVPFLICTLQPIRLG